MEQILQAKYRQLGALLNDLESVVVAFSAGVDSTFLLKVAHDVLGGRTLAVTGLSESYPSEEAAAARDLAKQIGVAHLELNTGEMEDSAYLQNQPDRCFHCKSDLFGKLIRLAAERGYRSVVDGCNADDNADYRPGMLAGRSLGVRSPLQEVGLTKTDIRLLARELGLPTWNKPAMACLSSRIPYGQPITPAKLDRIDRAERRLRELGFQQVRVRCHDDIARIEVSAEEIGLLVREQIRAAVLSYFKEIGFTYVALDLQGYRMGSMNEKLLASKVAGPGDGR